MHLFHCILVFHSILWRLQIISQFSKLFQIPDHGFGSQVLIWVFQFKVSFFFVPSFYVNYSSSTLNAMPCHTMSSSSCVPSRTQDAHGIPYSIILWYRQLKSRTIVLSSFIWSQKWEEVSSRKNSMYSKTQNSWINSRRVTKNEAIR